MIDLIDVSKSYRTESGVKVVLGRTSMRLPARHNRIAILGAHGSGKSTLVRIISGAEQPTTGHVLKRCQLSFPYGSGSGIQGRVSGRENVRFFAQIYGVDFYQMATMVEEMSELGDLLYEPMMTYPGLMRAKFVLALFLALDFDCYLLDEAMPVGNDTYLKNFRGIFEQKLERSGIILSTQSEAKARRYCNMGIVLHAGRLIPFETVEEAIDFYVVSNRVSNFDLPDEAEPIS